MSFSTRLIRHATPVALVAVGASLLLSSPAGAAPDPVGLGTATSFAVLAGSGITNTGATTITGDVGTFPTTTETGFASVVLTGTDHGGDSVTQGAKTDLVTAYDDAAGRIPATNVATELGGTTLAPGIYRNGTLGLTGTVTLDFQNDPTAVFVFQAASTLITEVNGVVAMINGGDACRVVWQVGSSATFKTGTQFAGDVLALTSISAQAGATFNGRLLARTGAVTLINNTINRGTCASIAPTPTTTTTTAAGPASNVAAPTTTAAPTPTTTTTPSATSTTTSVPIAVLPTRPTAQGSAAPVPATDLTAQGQPNVPPRSSPPLRSTGPELPRTGGGVGLAGIGIGIVAIGGVMTRLERPRRR